MSESVKALLTVLVEPFQEIEDAAAVLYSAFSVDDAVGAQLDWVGYRVGERRKGRADTAYRAYIKARIAANTSDGKASQLYGVARAILGMGTHTLALTTTPPAAYELRVQGAELAYPWDPAVGPDDVAVALADALLLATVGGVALQLLYQHADDAHTFRFASGDVEEDDADAGFASDDDETGAGGLFAGVESRE